MLWVWIGIGCGVFILLWAFVIWRTMKLVDEAIDYVAQHSLRDEDW